MNKVFRLIWSDAKQAWLTVAEKVASRGSIPSFVVGSIVLCAAIMTSALPSWALDPVALPTNGQIVAGSGSIAQSGSSMTVNQNSDRMIANWGTFNIGQNAAVKFQQPGASSVALNRIQDQNPSQIMGSLSANGKVFLVNPSGIIFGQSARVDVGSLVASSLNLSNENFLAGKYTFSKDGLAGKVENFGNIIARGGVVALLSPQVSNSGSITANSGSVVMAAGEKVTLDFVGDGLVNYSVEQGAVDALAENSGLIKADGGLVVMTAKAADRLTTAVVNNTGVIEAQTIENRGGRILLLSDMEYGETIVSGRLDATAPNGGDGGFIETSAAKVSFGREMKINASSKYGESGTWLIDPYNYTIDAAAATAIVGNAGSGLNSGTNVTVETGTSNTTYGGSSNISDAGDITVTSPISKTLGGDATLTLKAHRHITLDGNASIASSSNKLNLHLWADSDNSGDGINIVASTSIDTNGGWLKFGNNQTATINSVPGILVGGDVFFNGSALQTISTGGGAVDVYGETIIGNTAGVTINSAGGNIGFHGLLNSGNQYTFVDKSGAGENGSWDVTRTEAKNGTGGGSAVNDSYLVTITSRLENAIAGKTAGYTGAWIGAWRPVETNGVWTWADGPEAGNQFFTQTTNGSRGTTTTGYYSNFGAGEPNGSMTVSPAERVGQFYGTAGGWNDLNMGTPFNQGTSDEQYKVRGYVRETNLLASPLTINAGAGVVTFSGAVGSSKALASLNVTSTNASGIAINGGAVTTTGLQTYNGNVTLGSASTVLTQTAANTDFTLQAGKSINYSTAADASLTIKTTANIIMDTSSSISSSAGKLNTVLWSDSDANGGAIFLKPGSAITSNGGNITLGGGLALATGYAKGVDSTANLSNGITILGATLASNGGNITLRGRGASVSATADSSAPMAMGVEIGTSSNATSTETLIDSGSGKIAITGQSNSSITATNQNFHAVEIGTGGNAWTGNVTVKSSNSAADAISITGDASALTASSSTTAWANGILLKNDNPSGRSVKIEATAGGVVLDGKATQSGNVSGEGFAMFDVDVVAVGPISITGQGNSSRSNLDMDLYSGTIGYKAGTSVTSSSTNITLNANTMTIGSAARLQSSGALAIQPRTAATTIGIAGGSGTLQLASSYFSTNFTNGFSGITIGSATAGDITVAGSTTYNDPLTLKTKGNITVNHGASLTGTAGQNAHLTLWSDADGNSNGRIAIDHATISTNAGHVWMGGGSGAAVWNTLNVGNSAAYSTNGIGIEFTGGSVLSGGGNIYMRGASTGVSAGCPAGNAAQGIRFNNDFGNSTTINSGTGSIYMHGSANNSGTYTNGIELSDWNIVHSLTSTATSGDAITLIGDAGSATGTWTYGISLGANITTSGGNISITGTSGSGTGAAIQLSGDKTYDTTASTGTGNVSLTTTNNGTISADGIVKVGGTTTLTAGTGDISLNNTQNNFTGAVSVVSGKDIVLIDQNAMTLGAVTTTGTVDVATVNDDLTLTGAVQTTNATASAIKLNAGKSTAAGTSTGGNIIVSGGSVSVGNGGRATLFSGDSADTTLATLVRYSDGSFRYNSDETTNFSAGTWTALGTGTYGIYRVQPTLTVTADNQTVTYGTAPSSATSVAGLQNGDTAAQAVTTPATVAVGGTPSGSGKYTAGAHSLTPSGAAGGLGYAISHTAGTLTVIKLDLTVTGLTASNKAYDATTTATLGGTATVSALEGDTVTVGGTATGVFADKNVGDGKGITVTGNTITGNDSDNYNLIQQTGLTANISKADLTVSGLTASSKTYDATNTATLGGTAAITKLGSDDVSIGGTASGTFANKNVGDGKAVTVTGTTISGADATNYNLIQQTGLTADISKADLAVTGLTASSKTYDATNTATLGGTATITKLGSDDVTIGGSAAGTFANKNVGDGKAITVSGTTISGADASNYNLIQQTGLTADITKAPLTVTANDKERTQGTANPILDGIITGFVGEETSAVLTAQPNYSTIALASSPTGSYPITAADAAAENYSFTYVDGALTVTQNNSGEINTILASVSSPQHAVNGTQEQRDSTGATADSATPDGAMGPGGGIDLFQGNDSGKLITDRTGSLIDEEVQKRDVLQ